jgi:predicted PhzF superfamily epimerase YddE/YHI9
VTELQIGEDPVTGSLHCSLGVLYSDRFGGAGQLLRASQGGKRVGEISILWDGKAGADGGRVRFRGATVTGQIAFLSSATTALTQCSVAVAEGMIYT